jgi:predicted ATPase
LQSHGQIAQVLHDRFLASEQGGMVCVMSGSPGSGKTSLARRFLQELPEDTPRLRGKGLQSGVAPLLPICEAIRSYQHGSNYDQLRAAAEEYAVSVPILKEVLGPLVRARTRTLETSSDLRQVIPPETFTFVVLSRLIAALEGAKTPVLFVDDIQWLDASSLAFLGYFASQIRERQVFLLLVRRQNGHVDRQTQSLLESLRRDVGDSAVELVVGGLSREEQIELVKSMLGPVCLDDAQLAWLEASSQAKPYYLRELINLLRERGSLVKDGGVWRLVEQGRIVVPPSLNQYIEARLARATDLNPLIRDIIQYGACAGTSFDARVVAAAMGEPARLVGNLLQIIERETGLIQRLGQTTCFTFDHDLTREAVLTELGDFAYEARN